MKLDRLSLTNFRQFYGDQELIFDHSSAKNVYIVFGANGAGKTTLLNSMTWVLYKRLSEDFEQPGRLVNNRAWDECSEGSTVDAIVEIEFTHDSRRYIIKRIHQVRKVGDEQIIMIDGEPELHIIDENGGFIKYGNPANAIDHILPKRLHPFFFFNGERIERLAQDDADQEIEAAVKILLGLEVFDRGKRHLDGAIRELRKEQAKVGSLETQKIVKELERLDSQKRKLEIELSNLYNESSALDEDIEEIKGRLRLMDETRELQKRRDQFEQGLKGSLVKEKELRDMLRIVLTKNSYLVFLSDLSDQVVALIEGLRVKGEIPAPIKRQFVEDLLEEGLCICETRLVKGEPPYLSVEQWLYRGGDSDVEDSIAKLNAEIVHYSINRPGVLTEIADINRKLVDNSIVRKELEEKLDDVGEKLKDFPLEEVSKLEEKRDDILSKARANDREIGSKSNELKSIEETIKVRTKELERVKEVNTRALIAQQRVIATKEARDFFEKVHNLRSHDVRVELDDLIREVYSKIDFKGYQPYLNDNFLLELRDPNREHALVAKAAGENQILSLSFIGALAKLARKPKEDIFDRKFGALIKFEGGNYPVVIDAAFGQLEGRYQQKVASALPTLANQVIVFVSKSQGMGPVLEYLTPFCAGISILHYRTVKKNEEEERIRILGEEFPYISRSIDGSEWASIDKT